MPSGLPEQFAAKDRIASSNRLSWKQSFSSERLQADIEMLSEENFDMKAARLPLAEASALADQPELDLQGLLVESWVTHHASRKLEQILVEQRALNGVYLQLTEFRLETRDINETLFPSASSLPSGP